VLGSPTQRLEKKIRSQSIKKSFEPFLVWGRAASNLGENLRKHSYFIISLVGTQTVSGVSPVRLTLLMPEMTLYALLFAY